MGTTFTTVYKLSLLLQLSMNLYNEPLGVSSQDKWVVAQHKASGRGFTRTGPRTSQWALRPRACECLLIWTLTPRATPAVRHGPWF